MPRIVFQLFWDYIQAGKPIVAFVKNLAKDGRYYWVVALAVPIPEGYLSVRFKPTSPLLDTVKHLYGNLKAVEAAIEEDSKDRKAAIAASREVLNAELRKLGFSGYDDFMQRAFKREMQSRETSLGAAAGRALKTGLASAPAEVDSPETVAEMFDKLAVVLNALFGDLEVYVDINLGVSAKSGNVVDISESLRVSALNGVIAVDKLGTKAAGLRPVLDWLRVLSEEITQEGFRLSTSLNELVREVDWVVFGLSAAKLQNEMTVHFAHELAGHAAAGALGDSTARMTDGAIRNLHASSSETVRGALSGLEAIRSKLKALTLSQTRLLDSSHSLRPVYLTGKIEMADGVGTRLAAVFRDLGSQLEETEVNLGGLKTVLESLEAHLLRGLAHGERIEETIARIDSQMIAA
jgi:aerotaxis receptor